MDLGSCDEEVVTVVDRRGAAQAQGFGAGMKQDENDAVGFGVDEATQGFAGLLQFLGGEPAFVEGFLAAQRMAAHEFERSGQLRRVADVVTDEEEVPSVHATSMVRTHGDGDDGKLVGIGSG